jgi:hypothetical protein
MFKNKQAVNQQQDNNLNVQTVQIGKLVASFLVPDYNEGQKLSVIDEGVLKYLKSLLPKASVNDILDTFVAQIEAARLSDYNSEERLQHAVDAAKDFVAFHTSVNLLKQYFDPKTTVVREEPFNAEPRELTITEMIAKFNEMTEEWDRYKAKVESHPDYPKSQPQVIKSPQVVASQARPE